jgi:tRNA(Ile)-lysidine synthase
VHFCDKKPLFTRAVLMALKALGLHKDYTSVHLDAVFYLQQSERGATLDLPQNICAEKQVGGIYLYCKKEEYYPPLSGQMPFSLEGFDGGRYEVIIKNQPIKADNLWKVLRFDEEKLPKGAVFRFRQDGDWIRRFGSGKKTLKKFFNEEKIPTVEREWLPMLAQADGNEVFAVCGVEISEKIKVDDGTKKAVYIAIRKKE